MLFCDESLIDFGYATVLLVFASIVGWRYLQKSIEFSWHLSLVIGGLPLCYYVLDSIGVLVFAVTCALVYEALPVPQLDVDNKTVLITGCDSGFGHATAKYLDSIGFNVFAGCLFKGGEGEKQLIESCSTRLTTLQLDVTKEEQIKDALEIIKEKLEGQGLWGLVNNAGILAFSHVEITPIEVFQKLWDINCLGGIRMIKAFLPLVRKCKGRIVNVTSTAGRTPMMGNSAYCISNAAMEILSDVLRQEMSTWGVNVSIIEPAGFLTAIAQGDKLRTILKTVTDNLSEEVISDYDIDGFTAEYEEAINSKMIMDPSQCSSDVTPVVMAICGAMLSSHPKTRYRPGKGAILTTNLSNYLPSTIFDLIFYYLYPKWVHLKPKQK
ncbi:retinol dehydrogenase 7-like [Glandiceps talaboti]